MPLVNKSVQLEIPPTLNEYELVLGKNNLPVHWTKFEQYLLLIASWVPFGIGFFLAYFYLATKVYGIPMEEVTDRLAREISKDSKEFIGQRVGLRRVKLSANAKRSD